MITPDVSRRLVTGHVILREATPEDAGFIVSLRRDDPRQLLAPLPGGVDDQVAFLNRRREDLAISTDEVYFIVVDRASAEDVGTVRFTSLRDPSRMGWESLIVRQGTRPTVGLDVIVTAYRYCFEYLRRPMLGPWRVPRSNAPMISMHERMGLARIVSTDDALLWYVVAADDYKNWAPRWRARGLAEEVDLWPRLDGVEAHGA